MTKPFWAGESTWERAELASKWADALYADEVSDSEKLEVTEAIAAHIIDAKTEVFEDVKREILEHYNALHSQFEVLDVKRETDTLDFVLEAIDALYEKVN